MVLTGLGARNRKKKVIDFSKKPNKCCSWACSYLPSYLRTVEDVVFGSTRLLLD